MSDYANAALPVFTPGDGAQKLQTKIIDATTPTQGLAVDASGALSDNLTKVGGTAVDTNNGVTSAGTLRVTVSSDSTGQIKLATGANTIGQLTANQSVNVDQIGGSSLALGQTTMASSVPVVIASNQTAIPVSIASTAGTEVYHSTMVGAVNVAAGGTATNTYTVTTGKTLSLSQIFTSASGKIKAVVTAPSNATTLIATMFNSTASPNAILNLNGVSVSVAATNTVVVTITNDDNQPQDVYSTIFGIEN